MKLLEAQPEIAPGTPPEPPAETPPEQVPADPGARSCRSCGATMDAGQDWCLACGTAAGPVAARPGRRPAVTVLGLTALLVLGAVVASYAALREDRTVPPSQTAAAQVAQAPPAATTTTPPATTPPESTTTTPAPGTKTGKSKLPKVQVPSSTAPVPAPVPAPKTTPAPAATPRATTPPATSSPTPTTPSTPATPSTPGGGSQTTPGAGQSTTPAPAAPVAIDLGQSAAAIYDPYRRATATGVPGKALDDDGSTSWYVDTVPGAPAIGAGFAVNLGEARGIRSIDITTPTPGFKVEVYASDEATPPPAITDTRWAHITDKRNVGEDGKTHIVLGAGTSKYQTLLLWITTPPADGARVRISELKVFG
jgi:hypothetical protein